MIKLTFAVNMKFKMSKMRMKLITYNIYHMKKVSN